MVVVMAKDTGQQAAHSGKETKLTCLLVIEIQGISVIAVGQTSDNLPNLHGENFERDAISIDGVNF